MELPPSSTPVDQMFTDLRQLQSRLGPENLTELIALDGHFRKVLVLGAASHLEDLMTFHLREHMAKLGEANLEFIRRFALERKFFQWFNFNQPMPDAFFKQFGSACSAAYKAVIEDNSAFESASRSFMTLCATRNNLVHNNLASYSFDLSVDDIESSFRSSLEFPPAAVRIVGSCS